MSCCALLAAATEVGCQRVDAIAGAFNLSQCISGVVRIVEMRFLAGLSVGETGEALGISPTTVKRDAAMARAWLFRELGGVGAHAS